MTEWLVAFTLTQALEIPLYLRAGAGWRVAFLASALTHPVVWFGFPVPQWLGLGYWSTVVLVEAFAVGAEALWLSSRGVSRALAWSLLANAASFTLGLVLHLA